VGLLDIFNTGDPEKDAAISRGLLSAGLQLMQSRGKFLPNLGQGGMAGLGGFDQERQRQVQAKRIGLQDELLRSQLDEQKRNAELAKLPGQFYRAPSTPGVDATGGMDTALENPNNAAGPGGFDMSGYINALYGKSPVQAMQLQAALQKDDSLVKGQPGDVFFDKKGNRRFEVPAAPPKEDLSPVAKLIKERDKLDPADPTRRIFDEAIRKASTHQPPVSVSYGAPVAGQDEKGNSVFFQPSKDGNSPPSIVKGVKPAPQNRDTKLPAELQRMQIAGDAMGSLLNDYEAMLKKHNPRDPMVQANPAIRAEMQSLKRNLELQFKELQALGALAGPDIEIMRQALGDPFSFSGAYYGREGLLGQVSQARRLLQVRKDAVLKSQGKTDSESAPASAPRSTGFRIIE
jgi:hypothetical protein